MDFSLRNSVRYIRSFIRLHSRRSSPGLLSVYLRCSLISRSLPTSRVSVHYSRSCSCVPVCSIYRPAKRLRTTGVSDYHTLTGRGYVCPCLLCLFTFILIALRAPLQPLQEIRCSSSSSSWRQ